jgi:hypothetical protein
LVNRLFANLTLKYNLSPEENICYTADPEKISATSLMSETEEQKF